MESIWEILQLNETRDRTAIKRAYAALAKTYNPEEYPQEFLRIRQAYEKALAYAETDSKLQVQDSGDMMWSPLDSLEGIPQEKGFHWDFVGENLFQDSLAVHHFKALYTGKCRKDRAAWSDYFSSDAFLEGYREKDFAKLLLRMVMDYQENCLPTKEFLTELYIAYGLRCDREQIIPDGNAVFSGIEHIIEIARMGPLITRLKGNDPALAAGFRDYRELLNLASKDIWDSSALLQLGKLIDCYQLHHISDKPIQNANRLELFQRHPKSLRLITYFFTHAAVPAQAYRILWSYLRLENATNGREKLLYGGLREAVLVHVPELLEKSGPDYKAVLSAWHSLYTGDAADANDKAVIDRFFEREDVQCVLTDEIFGTFVGEPILYYWITKNNGAYYIKKLESFYVSHRQAPYAAQALGNVRAWKKKWKKVNIEFEEDEHSELVPCQFDFHKRAYVRYYLNTAFHQAYGIKNHILLTGYLQQHMPYSAQWSRRLVSPEEGGFCAGRSVEMRFGENVLNISFHRQYMEYLWNGMPYGPSFLWGNLLEMEDEAGFWLLLPVATASVTEYHQVYQELVSRLSNLPVSEEDVPVIADCIAGKICGSEDNSEKERLVCSFYAETEEQLYGCDVYRDGTLCLYEEAEGSKTLLQGGEYHVTDVDTAVRTGKRLLKELTSSCSATVPLLDIPDRVFVSNQWNQPGSLEKEQVTQEAVNELIEQYFAGKVNRLELSWDVRDLVFINNKNEYACFYFDNGKSDWYALVAMPEVYATVESEEVIYTPFGLGMLPNYLIHQNLNLMQQRLKDIFSMAASASAEPEFMVWSPQIYRFETRLRYCLAKRLFGGYPAEQARNQIRDRFYLPVLPSRIAYTDSEGNQTEHDFAGNNKAAVQETLSKYMAERVSRLTLTWQYEEENWYGETVFHKRHIILIQDQGCHQMLYLEEEREYLAYLVANVREYLEAEGKKFHKVSFCGRTVPGYLVHQNLRRIRDYMDLLFSQIKTPYAILDLFGEFSYREEEYQKIKAEYMV